MLIKQSRHTAMPKPPRRRGRPTNPQLTRPDYPYTMKLPDGRTLFVEVPGRWTTNDRDGSILILPDGVRFLDRIRVLANKLNHAPTPGYITTLRESLNLTQAQFGQKIGVDKVTVSRWERGELRPSDKSLAALEKLRAQAAAKGAIISG
jgi:DNA-binding transcriptional regulator YiaG